MHRPMLMRRPRDGQKHLYGQRSRSYAIAVVTDSGSYYCSAGRIWAILVFNRPIMTAVNRTLANRPMCGEIM